ncbi:DUF389 domain-containing protein [Thermomonospora umbrina]|uniref:Putative hydrophobic protein (TIGR00271 family) n=1 Tax=Thermomonospora umbrina TaxID=111806 RepID=A0A3D9SLX0_9ACTN|nr:DUF389 domain-containing protein [Thermomonospora umbrina]REE96848.1 putative hydrophobic protein (TIGR00271 family) [Thermomonospora umbrina]
MLNGLRDRLVPAAQRRTPEELTDDLDLRAGDRASRYSAFWTLLVLSAVIAATGVLSDSTATVIGAMIIAPLSTPIMGMALGLVQRSSTGAGRFVLGGTAAVIGVGLAASLAVPGSYELLSNGQIAGRTSPGLADLIAAMATGLAGAIALARRDVAAILPGVAIAISLVPPLVVAGVCLGRGAFALAFGALVLFLSNMLSLVLAGTFVFASLGYTGPPRAGASRARVVAALSGLGVLITVVLVLSTVATYAFAAWENEVRRVTAQWLASDRDAEVIDVRRHAATFHISVRVPGEPPPVSDLLARLRGVVPDGVPIVVETTRGRVIDAGRVGSLLDVGSRTWGITTR